MKKYILFVIIYTLIHVQITHSQSTQFESQVSLPQLPEVAGFKKYGDIPVSEYTGVPDISIPLYTLKQGTLELPVTLSYHASGIKVEQEASWVGLGWDLLAGAAISREPVGELDLLQTRPEADPIYWNLFNELVSTWRPHRADDYTDSDFLTSPRFGMESASMWWNCPMLTQVLLPGLLRKLEPDIYSGNLPNGKNFKFTIHPYYNTPLMVEKADNLTISFEYTIIRVIDSDGTTYLYEAADYFSPHILSYRLKSMTSKEGHTIQLNYTTVREFALPKINDFYTFNPPPEDAYIPSRSISSMTSGNVSYLYSIESDNERITFEMGAREDRSPGTTGRLTRIKIYNKLIQENVRYFDFTCGYFVGEKTGGDFLNDGTNGNNYAFISEDARKKRLKLLSLTVRDARENTGETYSFAYKENIALPYKTSCAQDYWGYYNGAENASTIIRPYKHTILPILDRKYNTSFLSGLPNYPLSGAIRNCSRNYITAGMLKSINYPTGGSVEFEFEPHEFSNYRIVSKEDIYTNDALSYANTMWNGNMERSTPYEFFTIPFKQTVRLDAHIGFHGFSAWDMIGVGSSIRKQSNPIKELKIVYEDCAVANPPTSFDKTDTITLEAGEYQLTSGFGGKQLNLDALHSVKTWGTVVYKKNNVDFNTLSSIGGGIRIKNIIKKGNNGSIVEKTGYKYESANGKTSGRLLIPLIMVKEREIRYITHVFTPGYQPINYYYSWNYNSKIVSSSPIGVQPGLGSGLTVGYSRVITEKYTDTGNAGKTVSEFFNQAGKVTGFDDMIVFEPHNNGALLKQQIYNSDNKLLKQNRYEYEIKDIKKTMINIKLEDSYSGKTIFKCLPKNFTVSANDSWDVFTVGLLPRFKISIYPAVSYRVDLKKHTETSYFGNDSVTQNLDFLYNSYHQVSSITHNADNPSALFREYFTYPSDISNYPYPDMKANNVISPVVWYSKTKGNSTTTTTNQYGDWQNKFALLSTREQSGSTDSRTLTYKYDPKYNPVEATYQDAVSDVYLWGYNYSYMIAHLKNTTYATVQSRMGSNLARLCSANAPDSVLLNSLRTLFPECEVTTWLYRPSFGVRLQTDPHGVRTTYQYDSFGRLQAIKDENGKTIESYDYHFLQ